MSKYIDIVNSFEAECPYCRATWHVEAEDYSEDRQVEECYECGKKFWVSQTFTIDHETNPDCELNGEEHDYELHTWSTGSAMFCKVCEKIEERSKG